MTTATATATANANPTTASRATCRLLLLTQAALATGCVPPRQEVFGPVASGVEQRLGEKVTWRETAAPPPETRRAIRALLRQPLDADRAARIALLASPALQAELDELGVRAAALAQVGAPPNPELEAAVRFPASADRVREVDLRAVEDVVGIIQSAARHRVASAELEAARRRAIAATIRVAAGARIAWARAAADQQILAGLRTLVAAARASYDLARRLHDAGNITDLTLSEEQALYEQSRIDLSDAQGAAARSRAVLDHALGLPAPAAPVRVAELTDPPRVLPPLLELEREAVAASVELDAMRWDMRAARREVGVGRLAWVPHLGLGVSVARDSDGWGVGPAAVLSLPLLDTGQGERAAAWAHLRRARARYADRAIAVRAEARAIAGEVTAAHARARRLADTLVPLRHRIVEESLLEYNAMQLSPFELLLARQQEVSARRRYTEAARDYWIAAARLDALRAGALIDPSH